MPKNIPDEYYGSNMMYIVGSLCLTDKNYQSLVNKGSNTFNKKS